MAEVKKRTVTLVDSSYQPKKAELEEPITFPEGTTPDDLARALMQSVDINWTPNRSDVLSLGRSLDGRRG